MLVDKGTRWETCAIIGGYTAHECVDEELKNAWKSDRTFASQEDGLLIAHAS